MYILNNEIFFKDEHVGFLKGFVALIFHGELTEELNNWLKPQCTKVIEMQRK